MEHGVGRSYVGAAVRGARDVISADIARQRDVVLGVGADPFRRQLQRPHFRRAEMFDDLGAGVGFPAPIENAARRQMADVVGPVGPPLRAFAAGLIELQHAVLLRPAEIQGYASALDDGPCALIHLATVLLLVNTHMTKLPSHILHFTTSTTITITNTLYDPTVL